MTDPTPAKTELIERLQAGDVQALSDVRRLYGGRVFGHAVRILRDSWDAEEVVQDVIWQVYKNIKTLENVAAFEGWLYRVTRNACLMVLRRRKRIPMPLEAPAVEAMLEEKRPNMDSPDGMLDRRRALVQAQRAFEGLAPLNRRIFFETDVRGRAKNELAGELGISISSLKSRLHRARASVRSAFTPLMAA